jgi:hypothetical protein
MLKKVLLILFGLIIGLLLIEMALRLFDDWLPDGIRYHAGLTRFHTQMRDIHVPDSYLWHKSVAGVDRIITGHPDYNYRVQTNSLGFDDIGFRDDGIDDQSFAIALGDSFTWGDGVDNDKIWVERLETETSLDVANLGMSGYGSLQELRLFQTYGLPLKPKLILWTFFPNDLYDDGHFVWREETGRLARREKSPSEPSWSESLDTTLRGFSVTYNWVISPFSELDDEEEWERLFYTDRTLDLTFVMRPYWEKRLDPSNERVALGKELIPQVLSEVQATATRNDATLVVVLFPFKEQVYWPIVSTLVDNPDSYDVNWPTDWVGTWCEEQDILYLDLAPIFREHAIQGEQLYFRYDAHWNERGHALVEQAIQQYLRGRGLIPEPGSLSENDRTGF